MGFVSYGGVSGGTRAVQMLKGVITALSMMPLSEAVHIPAFTKHMDDSGKFNGEPGLDKSADIMLNELNRWAVALKTMRG
jgi:NAD(P)H-dependent FMN reductase